MEDIQYILPVTRVKRELLNLLKRMDKEQSTVAVTRNGEAVGVLMTPGRYEALIETIEILGDKAAVKALLDSGRDFSKGRTLTHEEVWKDE